MIGLARVLLVVGTAVLLLPCVVLSIECLVAAVLGRRPSRDAVPGPRPRAALLVPAHDEASTLAPTLQNLREQLAEGDRLLVVADNCGDATAEVARDLGAEVVERHDPERRGKGFALEFGLRHLDLDPPEVVVIVDADCTLSEGGLATLARRAADTYRPVQAEYLLLAPEGSSPRTAISALAVIVRNLVRPLGLARLGLPCHLMGSGMAFPWPVIRKAPPTGSHLVEDLRMGIDLALLGHPPLLCREARVRSELPGESGPAGVQRRRWEHGHLATLLVESPRLVAGGLLRLEPGLVALGLDLLVPPLSLLVMLLGLAVAVAGLGAAFGIGTLPLVLAACGLGMVAVAVLAGWLRFGREAIAARHLVAIPFYIAWKVPIYVSLLVRGRHGTWERTERSTGGPD